jgi:hypothetical protein
MLRRWALVLALLCVPVQSRGADGYLFPPEKRGDAVARLEVAVQPPPPPPAKGERLSGAVVRLTVTVEGRPQLEVEPPHLADVTDSWKQTFSQPTRSTIENHTIWRQTIQLEQVKPGVIPLPALKVRFRENPSAPWEEVEWTNILRDPRGLPPIETEESSETGSQWLRWAIPLAVLIGLMLGAAIWKRRWPGSTRPLPPDQWALQELTRIETTALPPEGDAERFHTLLSNVVRRYLAERFQLRAPQQTTAEFMEAVRQTSELSPDQQALLREFFERCDLAKFARASTTLAECHQVAEMARTFVRETAASSSRSPEKA